jgi:prolipoprotein diacylglyceryltransferase
VPLGRAHCSPRLYVDWWSLAVLDGNVLGTGEVPHVVVVSKLCEGLLSLCALVCTIMYRVSLSKVCEGFAKAFYVVWTSMYRVGLSKVCEGLRRLVRGLY